MSIAPIASPITSIDLTGCEVRTSVLVRVPRNVQYAGFLAYRVRLVMNNPPAISPELIPVAAESLIGARLIAALRSPVSGFQYKQDGDSAVPGKPLIRFTVYSRPYTPKPTMATIATIKSVIADAEAMFVTVEMEKEV